MLTALDKEGVVVDAESAHKNVDYFCPECATKVLLRKGRIKIPHFSHEHLTVDCVMNGESHEHLMGKYLVFNFLKNSGWSKVQMERPFPEIDRRADVYAETFDEQTGKSEIVVFEIQNSSISVDDVLERTNDYKKIGVGVIWIPVFKSFDISSEDSLFDIGHKDFSITRDIHCKDWQIMMFGCHEGEVIAIVKDGSTHKLCFLKLSRVYREGKEWYDEYGELNYSSGHTLSNTYEGVVYVIGSHDVLFVNESKRKIKYDRKKDWDLSYFFGANTLKVKIKNEMGFLCIPHR